MNSHTSHRPLRVALYSHDTQGLGHIRRNLAIAAALSHKDEPPITLLISGTQVGTAFASPRGADLLTLPAVCKDRDGHYCSRSLTMPIGELIALRGSIIRSALEGFNPDVLIVDKVPSGLMGELLPALETLRSNHHTRCVLGLRDVLDDPETSRREWIAANSRQLISDFYDAVWVYGDPTVYDPVHEYGFGADVAAKTYYTGYLDRTQVVDYTRSESQSIPELEKGNGQRLVLCMVGGGEDGDALAKAFAQTRFPTDICGLLVTGPYMSAGVRDYLHRTSERRPRLQVIDFSSDPELLMRRADCVVSMGGYNTVCEILAQHKPALIVPRVTPRLEQWIRAKRLQELGLIDMLHPQELSPHRLSHWLGRYQAPTPANFERINLNGFARLPQLVNELLA